MHIPDGFLTPPVWATLDTVAVGTVAYAVKRVEREFDPEDWQVPLMGVTAAFVFAAQMFNFPVAGGTSGHLLGATLATALLGPWRAMLVMTAVFLVQALAFADGGVFALGANLFNMGILGCLIAHGLIQILWRLSGQQEWGRQAGIALAAWWSVELGAVATAVELALSGRIPLSIVLPAMAGVHAFIGVGEALLTVAAVNLVVRVRP
ncbi:MAG TPA: cobalamin biosynthesis protein CbiM, partial [Armatimonadetes bacterium]|nr:cobalamin biosynthesis protein CbiM [Armatimonadota bacterium]